MVSFLEELSDVFSVFHDGGFEKWKLEKGLLSISISCLYLAERVSPEFEYFYLELKGVEMFQYKPWVCEGERAIVINDLTEISNCDFEINSAKIVENHIEVQCYDHREVFSSPGGDFCIKAKGIDITTEDGNPISIEGLKGLSQSYWSNF